MTKTKWSKILGAIMAAVLVLMLLPTMAFADDDGFAKTPPTLDEVLASLENSIPKIYHSIYEVEVTFTDDVVSEEAITEIAFRHSYEMEYISKYASYYGGKTAVFKIPDEVTVKNAIIDLYADEQVLVAQPMYYYTHGTHWTQRLQGEDRYETGAAIVNQRWQNSGIDEAIVVCGSNWPDALTAASLAGLSKAPIILTPVETLNENSAATLTRLAPKHVTVIGGNQAVDESVFKDIEQIVGTGNVERIHGATRYETCEELYAFGKDAWSGAVIVASGSLPYDALSASPYAFASKTPVFLCEADGSLSQTMIDAIENDGITEAIIVGGTAAVPQTTQDELASKLGQDKVIRIAGANRYETSVELARWATGELTDMDVQPRVILYYEGCALATGEDFADALAAGPFCGKARVPLLLSPKYATNNVTLDKAVLPNLSKSLTVYVMGGQNALSGEIDKKIYPSYPFG